MDAPHMERSENGSMRAVAKIGNTGMEAVIPAALASPPPSSRVTAEDVARARRHSVQLERMFQEQASEHIVQAQSCPTNSRRLSAAQVGQLQEELRQTSPPLSSISHLSSSDDSMPELAISRSRRSKSSSYAFELDEIAAELRKLDMVVVG